MIFCVTLKQTCWVYLTKTLHYFSKTELVCQPLHLPVLLQRTLSIAQSCRLSTCKTSPCVTLLPGLSACAVGPLQLIQNAATPVWSAQVHTSPPLLISLLPICGLNKMQIRSYSVVQKEYLQTIGPHTHARLSAVKDWKCTRLNCWSLD